MPRWQIVKERRATFAATPEQNARRPPAATRWRNLFLAGDWTDTGLPATIEGALRSVGYGVEDARRLAEGLTSMDGALASVARGVANTRSAREQRCRERLATLSLGTQIGFSSREGVVRARLRYFYPEPGLLLLATEGGDGQEGLFEIDAIARQMAEGQAWVIRSRPADTGQLPGLSGADADRQASGRGADA